MRICITGASRGLGHALCKELTKHGHIVWGIARNEEGLRSLEQELPKDQFFWSRVDVTSSDDIRLWSKKMNEASFVPDSIVLNASIQEEDIKESYNHNAGHEVIDTNLEGPLRCIETFLPIFLQHRKGRFVAIVSTSAERPSIRSASYAASKAGLNLAMRTLQLRYRKDGVQFARVTLGPIATKLWKGKSSLFIPKPETAAKTVSGFICSKRRHLYYPFCSTLYLRLTRCLSDRLFLIVSTKLAG